MNEEEREFQVETTLDLATAQRRVSLQASIWQILLSPQYRASPLWGLMVEGTETRKGCVRDENAGVRAEDLPFPGCLPLVMPGAGH